MPIKWSTLRVSGAMDTVEEFVNQAAEPLEQARIVAQEARNIPNLPQYVDQYLMRIIGEIDRTIGGSRGNQSAVSRREYNQFVNLYPMKR
ncbi:hypothetical protein ACFLX4_01390 [Chloroflexota bacterium]